MKAKLDATKKGALRLTNIENESAQDVEQTVETMPDLWVRGGAIVVVTIWLSWLTFVTFIAAEKTTWPVGGDGKPLGIDKAGQLGDAFGVLNVLFTALAAVAVWWTGRMQREELILTRRDLQLQRQELRSTRKVVATQGFESMFFQTLRLIRDQRDALERIDERQSSTGLALLADRCTDIYRGLPARLILEDVNDAKETYGDWYTRTVYNKHQNLLGPYFRTLFYIFELVDMNDEFSDADKYRYAKLARAQLSSNEVVVLAANGCGINGLKFRKYIEKYALLKHYPNSLHRDFMMNMFDASAFD